jgi:hypothetical protein
MYPPAFQESPPSPTPKTFESLSWVNEIKIFRFTGNLFLYRNKLPVNIEEVTDCQYKKQENHIFQSIFC